RSGASRRRQQGAVRPAGQGRHCRTRPRRGPHLSSAPRTDHSGRRDATDIAAVNVQALRSHVVRGLRRVQRKKRGLRANRTQPFLSGRSHQNIRLSFTRTQRPFLICCTWVMVLARSSVLENLVGGELKMSRYLSPDSSASSIFWPVRSLPALLA